MAAGGVGFVLAEVGGCVSELVGSTGTAGGSTVHWGRTEPKSTHAGGAVAGDAVAKGAIDAERTSQVVGGWVIVISGAGEALGAIQSVSRIAGQTIASV